LKDPLITVVTPCRNPGERLARCVDSVADQTYGRVEHIIVDGASTDGTVDFLAGLDGVRWVSEPDSGQSSAINKGLRMMTGQVFTWLNADDTLKPTAAELAVAAFESDPALGWVHGRVEFKRSGRTWVAGPRGHPSLRELAGGTTINQPGAFITKWSMNAVGAIDESFNLAMDVDLWVRLLQAGIPGRLIPETLAVFEIHDASKSGSVEQAAFVHEEYLAFEKAGLESEAGVAHARWQNIARGAEVLAALGAGQFDAARDGAREILASKEVSARQRLFMSLAAASPPLARVAARLVQRI
jgi:glycosyltransferase involved in cell wall biosynthesis